MCKDVGHVRSHLENHVGCRACIVTNSHTVSLHDLVQGSKKDISLLHLSSAFFYPPVTGKTSIVGVPRWLVATSLHYVL